MKSVRSKTVIFLLFILSACNSDKISQETVYPVITTEMTPNDTDDPAIWYNSARPELSLILGTDKGDSTGGIFVFDLEGKLLEGLCIRNLKRPNNIDIEYGFRFQDRAFDIAVFTERVKNCIRVISLPDCKFIDNGGIPVFEDDSLRSPMGISLYKNINNEVFAFVGRKAGPRDGYIYQYRLVANENSVSAVKVRAFGKFSGKKEIESIVVDDELGYVYYSDENVGVRKYYADAHNGNEELAIFAQTGIAIDQEGLSIYKKDNINGYILLSDQGANKFHLFSRNGTKNNPHDHRLIRTVDVQCENSDGSDILNMPLNKTFPEGIFVAMSSDRTFQYYKADEIVGK